MASATTPTHGKQANVYRLRPNGFVGSGLNDLSWGDFSSPSASAWFEVEIDAENTPDTFRWRENGGAWNEGVAVTGEAQDLAGANGTQVVTFAATTGHTLGDKWSVGNLYQEACTGSGNEAQVTDSAKRILNENSPPVFTDSGAAKVEQQFNAAGKAVFDANVATVTATGNNGFIPESALEHVGYLYGWEATFTVDMADASRCGQDWKEGTPGQAGGNGSADTYFIGSKSFLDSLAAAAAGLEKYLFLKLFTWDPGFDGTGDHFRVWATITGVNFNAPIGDVVKEKANFQIQGAPYFVANV